MIRYELLKEDFFNQIENKVKGIYKQRAYFHTIQVISICQQLALKRNLNIELCSIIGLFHDYSWWITKNAFRHALASSEMTYQILNNYDFTIEEKNLIKKAISLHSYKDKIHDEYSEMIKDADIFSKYLDEPKATYTKEEKERIKKMLNEFI